MGRWTSANTSGYTRRACSRTGSTTATGCATPTADPHHRTRCRAPGAAALPPAPGGLLAWGQTRTLRRSSRDTSASEDRGRVPWSSSSTGSLPQPRPGCHLRDPAWHYLGRTATETLTALLTIGIPWTAAAGSGPCPAPRGAPRLLPDAAPWTPPPATPGHDPARCAALSEGSGLTALSSHSSRPRGSRIRRRGGRRLGAPFTERLGTRLPHAVRHAAGDLRGRLLV